jgi:hypothetical protein
VRLKRRQAARSRRGVFLNTSTVMAPPRRTTRRVMAHMLPCLALLSLVVHRQLGINLLTCRLTALRCMILCHVHRPRGHFTLHRERLDLLVHVTYRHVAVQATPCVARHIRPFLPKLLPVHSAIDSDHEQIQAIRCPRDGVAGCHNCAAE